MEEKQMKKLLCLILSLAMVFCLLGASTASAASPKDSVIVRCEQGAVAVAGKRYRQDKQI